MTTIEPLQLRTIQATKNEIIKLLDGASYVDMSFLHASTTPKKIKKKILEPAGEREYNSATELDKLITSSLCTLMRL